MFTETALEKHWSLLVRARAGNRCEVCGVSAEEKVLHGHHIFGRGKALIGMIHCPPLPGAPRYRGGGMGPILEACLRDADRLIRVALTSFNLAPKLLDCTPRSLLGAVIQCAQLGLEPGVLGHAYLIPFEKKKYNRETRQYETERVDVNVVFGYPGLIDLLALKLYVHTYWNTGQSIDSRQQNIVLLRYLQQ